MVELFESAFSRHFLDVDAESLRDFAAADAFLVELKCDLVAFVACCFDAGIKDDPLDCHVLDTAFAFSERSGGVADGLPGCCFCHGCTHSSDHNPHGCVRPSRPHTTMVHRHGAQTRTALGSWFRGCWAVADGRAIEARPSASRSRPGCADAVLPGRRLWWLRRPSRATQPLPVVPTPNGAGTTFKTLQVRLVISPCSVLSLGTRFASPKTTEAVRSPSVQISRSLRSHVLSSESEEDRTASVVTLLALSVPEAGHELR